MRSLLSALCVLCGLLWAAPSWAKPAEPSPAAQPVPIEEAWLPQLMARHAEDFATVLEDPARFRAQALVTEIHERPGEAPRIIRHGWRVDAEYFYPASAMKTIAAVAALQRARALAKKHPWLSVDTPLAFHALFAGEKLEERDPENPPEGHLTLRMLIRKMSIVSSNEAFNRLYDFAGLPALNEVARAAGLSRTLTLHRLSFVMPLEQQLKHPTIELRGPRETVTLPAWTAPRPAVNPADLPGIFAGKGELLRGKIVEGPKSFEEKNRMGLVDLQNMLAFIVRPDLPLGLPGFALHPEDRALLKEAMRQRPEESTRPDYSSRRLSPNRFKPIRPGLIRFAGGAERADARFEIYSKAGTAYGFRIENAYVYDKQTQRSYLFTVAIYVNENEILNDGKYEYEQVAHPFLYKLSEHVARALLSPPGEK